MAFPQSVLIDLLTSRLSLEEFRNCPNELIFNTLCKLEDSPISEEQQRKIFSHVYPLTDNQVVWLIWKLDLSVIRFWRNACRDDENEYRIYIQKLHDLDKLELTFKTYNPNLGDEEEIHVKSYLINISNNFPDVCEIHNAVDRYFRSV